MHNGADSLTLSLFLIMAPLRSLRGSIKNVFDRGELKDRETRGKGRKESKEDTKEELKTQHVRYRMKLGSQTFHYILHQSTKDYAGPRMTNEMKDEHLSIPENQEHHSSKFPA